jgi:hypothetical protein
VTGVQTCALPIYQPARRRTASRYLDFSILPNCSTINSGHASGASTDRRFVPAGQLVAGSLGYPVGVVGVGSQGHGQAAHVNL